MMSRSGILLVIALGLGPAAVGPGVDSAGKEAGALRIPPAYAPLENLIGPWKGRGVPAADRVKGWPEAHVWSWTFEEGVPASMTLTIKGGKTLAGGRLLASAGRYRLEGTDPAGKPVAFEGPLGPDKRSLVLERVGAAPDGARERLTLRMPANGIRCTVWLDRKVAGSPQYKRAIEVGLTREGENFASSGSAGELPKCVVTGGAATMSLSYQGKSFPICCTGCRDEFNESPEKYLARATGASKAAPGKDARPAKGSDDGFEGLVDPPAAKEGQPRPPAAKKKAGR